MVHTEPSGTSELRALIKRVESAAGPDRDLDVAVMDHFFTREQTAGTPYHHWVGADGLKHLTAFGYTHNLNATRALTERELPFCYWMARGYPEEGEMRYSAYAQVLGGPLNDVEHSTPELALLLAFLRAVSSSHEALTASSSDVGTNLMTTELSGSAGK